MKKFLISLFAALIVFLPSVCSFATDDIKIEYIKEEQSAPKDLPSVGCQAVYVIETNTGKVLYEKNAYKKMYPASTTKLLTALLALENCKMTDEIKVSKKAIEAVPTGYVTAKIVPGEKFSAYTLLQALLIPSANEAANAFAEHIAGNVSDFAKMSNERAKQLGCNNLHFTNPNGVHNKDHYCSAYDLYLIASECMKYDSFREIVKMKSFTLPETDLYTKKDRTFANTNDLLDKSKTSYYMPECNGIKTGHTDEAGECFVSSSTKGDMSIISVVMHGKVRSDGLNERFYDTKNLLEYFYDNYSYKTIAQSGQVFKTITVDEATKDTAKVDLIINTQDIATVVPDGFTGIGDAQIVLNENIKAPLKKNEAVGVVTFKADGMVYTADLVVSHDVVRIPYMLMFIAAALIGAFVLLILVLIFSHIGGRKKKKT